MALETCFKVSTVARNSIAHASRPSLPASKGARTASVSFSSSASIFPSASGLRPAVLAPRRKNSRGVVCEAKNVVDQVLLVNEANWDTVVIKNDLLVLVDFWAPWCGPCRMIEPTIEKLAKDFAGKAVCVKVNTDESPNLASKLNIRSIPTMILFKGGERKEVIVGAVPLENLQNCLNKYLD